MDWSDRMKTLLIALMAGSTVLAAGTPKNSVTFNKDVLPILQKNCQVCHRPGEVGPMAFLSYEGTRPWAKAMKEAVLTRKMPPWFADPQYGHYANDRRLSDPDIKTLVAWVNAGAPEGDAKDKPAPVQWNDGWNIKPDVVFEVAKPYTVPASGTVDYTYFVIPTGFTKDTWVIDGEVRPGNRSVVHHATMYLRPPGSQWMKDAKPGEGYVPPPSQRGGRQFEAAAKAGPNVDMRNEWFMGYVPGLFPQSYFDPTHQAAKLIPAGSDIVIEMHYTPSGKAAQDQTKVGLVLAKGLPEKRLVNLNVLDASFEIPPNDPNYAGHASATFTQPVTLIYSQPHMHMRGKDMTMKLEYPTGETETLVSVPHYNYLWQNLYFEDKPLEIPRGTKVDISCHWDNSINNPLNPDPTKAIRWGPQSFDEMLVGFVGVIVDRDVKPESLISRPQPTAQGDVAANGVN
jgi:Copper type II ascorbate-dependent monooxygenase, C-terminal domain